MASNGNGTTPTQQLEKVEAAIAAATADAPGPDLMSRVESAAQLLCQIAEGLGQVGEEDRRENNAFAEHLRSEFEQHIAKLIKRQRKRVADLERLLGKPTGMTTARPVFVLRLEGPARHRPHPRHCARCSKSPAVSSICVASTRGNTHPPIHPSRADTGT